MPAGATLINGPGGTINAAVGALGPRTLALALDNQGTVTLNRGLTLNRTSASHGNSGTITSWRRFHGDTIGDRSDITTSGAIAIGAGQVMQLTGGAFNYPAERSSDREHLP